MGQVHTTNKRFTDPVHLILTPRNFYHHFVGDEHKAQKGQVLVQGHTAHKWWGGMNSSHLTPKTMHFLLHYSMCENHCSYPCSAHGIFWWESWLHQFFSLTLDLPAPAYPLMSWHGHVSARDGRSMTPSKGPCSPHCMCAGWKVQRRLGLLVINKQNVSWQIMVWKLGDLASKPYLSLVGGVIPGKLLILSESQLSWLYNGSSDAHLAGVLVRTGSGLK